MSIWFQLTSFDISTSQFTSGTEMDTDEFTLNKTENKLRLNWMNKFFKNLRNEKSYRYGRSWRYRKLQVQG